MAGPVKEFDVHPYVQFMQSCGLVGVLDGSVGAVDIAGAREIAPVGRTQSERRRRLALAGGIRLLRFEMVPLSTHESKI